MKIRLLILLLTVVLSACDSKNNNKPETVIYNANVREAIGQFEKELARQRTEIVFENGAKANNCETYYKAIKASKIGEGVNNQIIMSEYLMCDVLLLVGDTKYIIPKIKPTLGKILAEKADLRSFPSSYFQMLDEENHTLNKLTEKIKLESVSASIDSDDWYYSLELVAITDVNKNGKADWIVWLVDKAKIGNYRGYQTLVAYDVNKKNGLIKLQPFPN